MEQSPNNLQQESTPDSQKGEPFEADSSKIVHRHLADKDHIITDEEIRSVRISTELPPFSEVTTGTEAATHVIKEENESSSENPITPWDTVK